MRLVQQLTVNGCVLPQMMTLEQTLSASRRAAMRGTSGQARPTAAGRKASSTMERRRGVHPREPKPVGGRGTGRTGSTLSIAAVARQTAAGRVDFSGIGSPPDRLSARTPGLRARPGATWRMADPAGPGLSPVLRRPIALYDGCAVTVARSRGRSTGFEDRVRSPTSRRGRGQEARPIRQDPSGPNGGLPFRTASSARSSGSCRSGCAAGSPRGAGRGRAP